MNIPTKPRRAPLDEVLGRLQAELGPDGWLVSGSAAMAVHGLPVEPRDLDLWCLPDRLVGLAATCGCSAISRQNGRFKFASFRLDLLGWDVEVVGLVESNDGLRLAVDAAMLARSRGYPPIESVEDLVAELLAMDRPAPKSDRARAAQLVLQAGSRFDPAACRERLARFGLDRGSIESAAILRTPT